MKGRDSDGYGIFTIDPVTGVVRTRISLDHEERSIYRLAVAATDAGKPPKQTVRLLRVEVLDLNDNRPTFTSSSLVFRVSDIINSNKYANLINIFLIFQVREDVPVGHIVGSISGSDNPESENIIVGSNGLHITYTLSSLTSDAIEGAFDMDRNTGSLVVARRLDREVQNEYRLEIRALDTSASNNPQSSAVTVKVEIADVNDNPPAWPTDPILINVAEDTAIGSFVYNFSASDADSGTNGEIQYKLIKQVPGDVPTFAVDPLTGTLSLLAPLDYETLSEYILVVQAIDQSSNVSERLSTSVTSRILITDTNDNAPRFISPNIQNAMVFLSDSTTVGHTVTHVVAVDNDSDDNGKIVYNIVSGNEDGRFRIDQENGFIELAKPLVGVTNTHQVHHHQNNVMSSGKYNLLISASDHGSPVPKESTISLQILIQSSSNNPPRFLEPVYHINISENTMVGSFVVRVLAKSFLSENGEFIFYFIS